MKAILKKCLCLVLTAGLLASLAACAGQTDTAVVKDLFDDLQKVSYSSTYTSLKDNKTNKTDSWRQGMVSGNGLQGFVTSGDPYSDTFIFQNMHFLLPNKNARTCPDTANELETVRQQIVKGQDITDNASYDDVYRYHPGGQLRMAQTKAHARDYVRYTDYATGQVGVRYTDKNGTWLRRSITSMADGVVITRLDPSTAGTALDLTLSYDDLSTLANFGKSEEVDLQYKKVTAEDGSALGMIAHYPDYENGERKDGGYATLTYVLPVGGTRERVTLDKQTKESQFVGDNTGVRITGAAGLVLLTVSDYTLEMGKLSDFLDSVITAPDLFLGLETKSPDLISVRSQQCVPNKGVKLAGIIAHVYEFRFFLGLGQTGNNIVWGRARRPARCLGATGQGKNPSEQQDKKHHRQHQNQRDSQNTNHQPSARLSHRDSRQLPIRNSVSRRYLINRPIWRYRLILGCRRLV